ncbi:MAG TPA: hypothetical protein VGB89_09220 [Bacteroidota bacterium]
MKRPRPQNTVKNALSAALTIPLKENSVLDAGTNYGDDIIGIGTANRATKNIKKRKNVVLTPNSSGIRAS